MKKDQASKSQKSAIAPLSGVVKQNKKTLLNALTAGLDLNEFLTCTWIQVQSDQKIATLAQRYPARVFKAMLQAARMGIYLDGVSGDGYLVVYGKDISKQTCVAQRGYKNYIRLFSENNPSAADMPVVFDDVRENDEFEFERGTNPSLHHRYAKGDRGDVTHYYAAARFQDGTCWPKVLTAAEVETFKQYAKTKDFWDSPHENTRRWMRIKTVIRQLFKEVPIPRVARRAMEEDESITDGSVDIAEVLGDDPIRGDEITPSQPKQTEKPQQEKPQSSNTPPEQLPQETLCEHGVPVTKECIECQAARDVEQEMPQQDAQGNPFSEGFFK